MVERGVGDEEGVDFGFCVERGFGVVVVLQGGGQSKSGVGLSPGIYVAERDLIFDDGVLDLLLGGKYEVNLCAGVRGCRFEGL